MYYLVKQTETKDSWMYKTLGFGAAASMVAKSKEATILKKKMRDLFMEAVQSDEIEFINKTDRTEIDINEWLETEDFMDLSIEYFKEGIHAVTDTYSIVSDESVPELT